MSKTATTSVLELLHEGIDAIQREAQFLDEERWDDWLAMYTPDCEYWVPARRADGSLTGDPQSELSHIYYSSRAGLEDRVVRIRSGRSPASTPMPRPCHILGSIRAIEPPSPDRLRMRSSWACHVFFPRLKESHAFFGRSEFELKSVDGRWLISRRKSVLQNDYIPTMLDIHCV